MVLVQFVSTVKQKPFIFIVPIDIQRVESGSAKTEISFYLNLYMNSNGSPKGITILASMIPFFWYRDCASKFSQNQSIKSVQQ